MRAELNEQTRLTPRPTRLLVSTATMTCEIEMSMRLAAGSGRGRPDVKRDDRPSIGSATAVTLCTIPYDRRYRMRNS